MLISYLVYHHHHHHHPH